MSLPQSPGLQPRESRAASVSSGHAEPPNVVDGLVARVLPRGAEARPRTNSIGHDLCRPSPGHRQAIGQDASRKISSVSCTNASLSGGLATGAAATTVISATPPVSNSKRGEVYV